MGRMRQIVVGATLCKRIAYVEAESPMVDTSWAQMKSMDVQEPKQKQSVEHMHRMVAASMPVRQ
jgi:hypothetical protein